jgi:transcriptional regulator of aromatic amino acid metabolism
MKKGFFEAADGGTLFLDGIGELSPLLQGSRSRFAASPKTRDASFSLTTGGATCAS